MAGRKYYVRRYRRKPRRNRKKKRNTLSIQKQLCVSDSQIVTLRYVDVTSINPGAATAASHVYSANSIYDPDVTGAGAQPLGHDQWNAFYSSYTVIGARMKATVFAYAASATGQAMGCITLEDNTTLITDVTQLLEQTNSKEIKPIGWAGSGATILTQTFSIHDFFGVKNSADVKDDFGAAFGANPIERAYFTLSLAPVGADPGAFPVVVEIEYICRLTERLTLDPS